MKLDPVTLEILINKFSATVEEMAITLQRTGRTLYVKETADFGSNIANLDGKLFAYPNGLGVSSFIDLNCKATIDAVGPLKEGDVIIANDPYRTKGMVTHLPDLTILKPYFHDGKIVAYGHAFVHLADIGGSVPSSISPDNTSLYQEGLIIPPIHLMREGEYVPEVVALFKANVRSPEENYGDLKAMLASLAVGERRTKEMAEKYGVEVFLQAQQDVIEYSRKKAAVVLKKIPDGVYEFWDYMDDDASTGIPIRLHVTMTADNGHIHLDFSKSDPELAAPFNIPTGGGRHPWLTLAFASFIYSQDNSIPLNAGMFDDITFETGQDTIVNPSFPTPVGIRHATSQRVNEVVSGALARAVPDLVKACNGGILIPVVLAQSDEGETGTNLLVVEPVVGGMGARPGHDGVDGRDCSLANLANNPIESVESSAEVKIIRFGLRSDSGGPGKWRGGAGCILTLLILQDNSSLLGRGMDRQRFVPWGYGNGHCSLPARTIVNIGREDEREVGKISVLTLNAGDTLTILTPGGGGYGDPLERDPEMVMRDVARDLVSLDHAARDYGVVIEEGEIDLAATTSLRNDLKVGRQKSNSGFSYGDSRALWEQAVPPSSVDRLNTYLHSLPKAAREVTRAELVRAAVPNVAQGLALEQFIDPNPSSSAFEQALDLAINTKPNLS